MNKIYKVIWSKTRNCYVAVAEFVKRNGKGGSVLNRRHIAAALAAVAICAAPAGVLANTRGHWAGADYIGDAPYNVTINEDVNGIAYGRYETDANAGASGATLSIVTGGKVDMVFGGRASSGDVTGNKVKMTGGEIVYRNGFFIEGLDTSAVYGWLLGGFAYQGKTEKNTVELSGGTVDGKVYGGYSYIGSAEKNTVSISGGTVKGTVHGGLSYNDGNVTSNTVTIIDGEVYRVCGGLSYFGGNATSNTVTISGGTVTDEVYGGISSSGSATKNTVTVSGGTVNNRVYGGRSDSGSATNNTVTISDGTVGFEVYGGFSRSGSATKNTVTISGGTVKGTVHGGDSDSGSATNNTVTISGGTVTDEVYGGRSDSGSATNNTVTISDGAVKNDVYGGFSGGDATGNMVTISGGEVKGTAYGGFSRSGSATKNTVTISGGTVTDEVYGGRSDSGSATNNTVTISDGAVKNDVYGGFSGGDATGNMVTISGGEVKGTAYGGFSRSGSATKNTVTISGGTVNGSVYGGYSDRGSATDNTVILSKVEGKTAPVIYSTLFGGYSESGGTVSNNTLQVEAVGLLESAIQNFDNYKFVLPSDVEAGDTMLKLISQSVKLEIDGSKVDMAVAKGSGLNIDFGESVTLLEKMPGNSAFSVENLTGAVQTSKLDGVSTGFDVMKYTLDKPDHEDKLNVTVSELHLYGDGGTNTPGQRETGNTLEIKGGKANVAFGGRASTGAVTKNNVKMTGGEIVKGNDVWIQGALAGINVSGNLFGGFADAGNVEKNTVEISGGTVQGDVFGGYSLTKGNVKENLVTIRGGKISGRVYGGVAYDGEVAGNTVILSKVAGEEAPVLEKAIYGGIGTHPSGNTLQVEAVGLSAPQISTFHNYRFVLPSDVVNGDTLLQLTAQNTDLAIESDNVSISTACILTGLKMNDSVTLLHKTTGNGALTLSGKGYVYEKLDGEADGLPIKEFRLKKPEAEEKVNAEYAARYLYGDGGTNTPGQRQTGNTLRIADGEKATVAFGGRATSGNVTGNKVTMTGGELVVGSSTDPYAGNLYGGLAEDGNARQNTVTIGGNSSIERNVYGGNGSKGAFGNEVTVTGGTVKGTVTGGTGFDGDTADNTVSIHGGSVGGVVHGGVGQGGNVSGNRVLVDGGLFTGYSIEGGSVGQGGNAVGNAVTVAGSATVQSEMIQGGMSNTGTAEKNTVTLKGGLFTNAVDIIGGHGFTGITDNAVNLTDTTKGLDNAKLRGYSDATVNHSGNELHIGGAKTYDKNGTATITKATWQGMDANGKHTNRVDTVSNFDSIALHNVVWGDTPALAAKEIKNIGGLDVTGLEFFTHPDNSTVHEHAMLDYMVLVHADNNDLTGLKISYLDEGNVKTEALTNQGIHYRNTVHHSTENGVTVDGKEVKRIFLADHNKSIDFFYHITGDKLTVGEVNFIKGGTARILDGRFDVRNAAIDTEGLTFTAASKLQMKAGDAMTLVDAEDAIANKNGATLQPFTAKQIANAYNFTPAEGVTVAATLRGTLNATPKNNGLVYKVNSNQADRLTFGSVAWKDSGALFKRPAAVTFAGAAVDTSEIHFKNLKELKGNAQMTLVSDFGGNPGSITGTTYKIGTTLEGEGAASLVNGDLIFTTKAGTKNHAQEQTHNTVMGMTAGLAALSGGTEQISQAMDILSLMDGFGGTTGSGSTGSTGNAGDNTTNGSGSSDSRENSGGGGAGQEENEREANGSIIASVGGGHMHQETGSHVTSNTWNGVLGIGGKRAVKSGTWQYAAFAEHGRANFTLHSDAGRGDGTSKYTGGGLLAKWQSRHDVYVEGSIRAGRMHDTASDLLYDAATGQSYGYDVHANYIGGHVGFGKVFRYNNGRSLDVYGKYFHMKRDGVSFEAEGHYDLDSVTSSVLRVGARYGATDKKWNWYGGLAYEYEFDGKATGRADGAPIRAASIKGGSVRGELGIRMEATKTSPWKADIRVTGYAGKRRGIGGNVSVAYTF